MTQSSRFIVVRAPLLVALSLLGVVGCGSTSDGGGGGGGFTTGLPRSKQLKDVTAAEAKQACLKSQSASGSVSDDAVRGICSYQLGLQGGEAACTPANVDKCVADYKKDVTPPDPAECDDVADDMDRLADCAATVGEWEDCINQQLANTVEAYSSLTCTSTQIPSPAKPAVCSTLETKCPKLFEDDGEEGDGNDG